MSLLQRKLIINFQKTRAQSTRTDGAENAQKSARERESKGKEHACVFEGEREK